MKMFVLPFTSILPASSPLANVVVPNFTVAAKIRKAMVPSR